MKLNKSLALLKKNILRDPWLALTSILIMTITFLTLNLFLFSIVSSNVLLEYLESKAQISVFFQDNLPEERIMEIKSNMEKDQRVLMVTYLSKEDALADFKEMSKDQPIFLESVESNPLPASLEVNAQELSDLQAMAEEFDKLEGVNDVQFYSSEVENFKKLSIILRITSLLLFAILTIISVIVVLIAVGITIHYKGVEVEIMKLVGATDTYVKKPLVMQGMFYGISAAFISVGVLFIFVPIFSPYISSLFKGVTISDTWWIELFLSPFLNSSNLLQRFWHLFVILTMELALGMLLGYLGSVAAIKKYLKY